MTNIDDRFLRNFFEIDESPEGDGELAEIRKKLVEVSFEHGSGALFREKGMNLWLGRVCYAY